MGERQRYLAAGAVLPCFFSLGDSALASLKELGCLSLCA